MHVAKDPVCGMFVDAESAKYVHSKEEGGVSYYFCSDMCLQEFRGVRKE